MLLPGEPLRVPEVLFVCVQNAGRSQMAADLRRALDDLVLPDRT